MTSDTEAASKPVLLVAKGRLFKALNDLRELRGLMGGDPVGSVSPRDVSIATTAVEDALLRLVHGTPDD